MREFYDSQGIKGEKTIVFSDSLDVELCLKYNKAARAAGFNASFGVGTFLTSESPVSPRFVIAIVLIRKRRLHPPLAAHEEVYAPQYRHQDLVCPR